MGLVNDIVGKTKGLVTPGDGVLAIVLGIINLILPGVGTIIGGILAGPDIADIIIGILQLVIPFVGWIWGWIWGLIMILRGAGIMK